MIAVLIVGIIAAVAIPSYRNSVIKGNRRAAQAAMMDIGQREQQYLLDARSYTSSLSALNYSVPSDISQYYSVTAAPTSGPPPGFTITATPVAGSMQASDGTLTLDNLGNKTPSNLW